MDHNNNFNRNNYDNPTEKPGYYTTPQNTPGMRYPQNNEPGMRYPQNNEPGGKRKAGFGIGLVVGILIMVVLSAMAFAGFRLSRNFLNAGTVTASDSDAENKYDEKIDQIQSYLDAYYMGEYTTDDVETSIAKGMLGGIGDKYAQYYSQSEFKELLEEIQGNYSGIGVSVALNDEGRVEVFNVFKGTPAEEAGILPGDMIIKAAGEENITDVDTLVSLVRGEEGTSVDITILRGEEEIDLTVERKSIEIPSIEYEMLKDNIGYIAISEFEVSTVSQFNAALDALTEQGMTSLIIDLRNNPGGDYDSVVAMADRVLPEGVIISTKDKNGNVKSENSDEAHKLTIPCVALVNENSASAAELFTGALQDYGVAEVVGTVTYGKGVVQSIFSLPDGSGMKFTTETYYTPKGRDINGVGIIPDYEVELPEDVYDDGVLEEEEDKQLQKAIELLTEK